VRIDCEQETFHFQVTIKEVDFRTIQVKVYILHCNLPYVPYLTQTFDWDAKPSPLAFRASDVGLLVWNCGED
jgi:hypothetical protein